MYCEHASCKELIGCRWQLGPNLPGQTKYDYLTESARESLARIRFGRPCSGCGITLATELDFARHFVAADNHYLNLGRCPNRILKGEPK